MLILGNPYPPPLVFLRGGMLILGNRYPPPLVFLRGGYAYTRKFIIDHQEIHTPPPGNLYPPPPVFLGGCTDILYPEGGYGCPGTNSTYNIPYIPFKK